MTKVFRNLIVACMVTATFYSSQSLAQATPSGMGELSAVLHCGGLSEKGLFVQASGRTITLDGRELPLAGYTMYPIHASWRDRDFDRYSDQIITMALHAGQNFVRPTDQWNKRDSTVDYNDPLVWEHLDHIVCKAQSLGIYVLMDLSAYKWLLIAHGQDPMDARLWTDYLKSVGHHYSAARSIVEYSIVGEPEFPRTQADADKLTAYYRQLTDTLYAADSHHLIAAGGYNHMNEGVKNWWEAIFSLPHNDVGNFKVYSQHDINLMPTVAAYGTKINKPLILEETGLPQRVGDSKWSGEAYNGIKMSRADFFNLIYTRSKQLGVSSVIIWNIACLEGPEHYDIYPGTPAAWSVMQDNAAITPLSGPATCPGGHI